MTNGIIDHAPASLERRLRQFVGAFPRVRMAVYFPDFAGQRSVKNQLGDASVGEIRGTAKITAEGLVVDGSDNSGLVFPTTFGVSNSSHSTLLVGAVMPAGNQGGSLLKVGESGGIAIGIGGTTFDDSGANITGLLENVAWVSSSTPANNGYHTFIYLHYQESGDRAAIAVDGTTAVGGSGAGTMGAVSGNTYVGGYNNRGVVAVIKWAAIVEGPAGSSQGFGIATNLAPRFFPAFGNNFRSRPDDDDLAFFTTGSSGVTINAGTGAAVGAGLSAGVASPITVAASVGAASAAGLQANVASQITIAAGVGAATGAGLQGNVASPITVAASVGAATAAGLTAGVASPITVSAGVGAAVGDGLASGVASPITVSAGVGAAAAVGLQASVSTGTEIAAGVGQATAAGLQATVSSPQTVIASVGAAVAAGLQATIETGTTIPAGIGAAIALGLTATVTAETHIVAGVGAASAVGLAATISQDSTAPGVRGGTARSDTSHRLRVDTASRHRGSGSSRARRI